MTKTFLTENEIINVRTGIRYIVDNGCSPLATAANVMRSLEADIVCWEREAQIGALAGWRHTQGQIAIQGQLKLQFNALAGRAAA